MRLPGTWNDGRDKQQGVWQDMRSSMGEAESPLKHGEKGQTAAGQGDAPSTGAPSSIRTLAPNTAVGAAASATTDAGPAAGPAELLTAAPGAAASP